MRTTLWLRISEAGQRHPVIFAVSIASIKNAAADLVVQKHVEKRTEIDWGRVSVFTAFGCFYQGYFQYALYVNLFRRMFSGLETFSKLPFAMKLRHSAGLRTLFGQIVVDCFVVTPLLFFPTLYIFKEAIQGGIVPTSIASLKTLTHTAISHMRANFHEDMVEFCRVWILGDAICFSCPLWLRLPMMHSLSFLYMCMLSASRGSEVVADSPPVPQL